MTDKRTHTIKVRTTTADVEHALVMVQSDGSECTIGYVVGTLGAACKEASRIAKGIEFDLRWMARR